MQLQPVKIHRSSSSWRRNRVYFYTGISALILLVVVTSFVTVVQLHRQMEKRAITASQNLAKSLELTFGGLIDTINMALLSSSDEITHQISHGKPDALFINRTLSKQKEHISHIPYIRATNETGDVIYGPSLARPFNVSHRDYFIHLRDDPSKDLFVSKPSVSVLSNKWIWTFARRINKPDGSFAGVIYAPIHVDEIHDIFARMDIGPGSSITLRDNEHGLIHRYAPASTAMYAIGDKELSFDLKQALEKNSQEGTYTNQTPYADGVVRIHSYYRNPNYGFTVIVGLSRDAVFAEWRKQAWVVAGLVAAFILALLAFSRMISRSWRWQEQAISSLETSQQSLQEAQKIAQLGQYTYDLRNDRWMSSEMLDDIFGIKEDYPRTAQGWLDLVAPEAREEMQRYLNATFEQRQSFDLRYRIIRPCDGQDRWVHGKGELQFDAAGHPIALFGTIQDITKTMAHETELEHVANYDSLTGLPNRRLLADRLGQAVARARRNGTYLAVCYLDLDEFKPINDRYGHDAGDKLLRAITHRLKDVLRQEDTMARIGGDEFVLLFGDLERVEELHVVLNRVLTTVSAGVQIEGITVHLSASIGATIYPVDDVDSDGLLRHADFAMYHAKEAGRNRYHLFDQEHNRQVQEHRYNLRRLSEALTNDEFVLHYQPKVDLLSGQIVGAEALIRWQHPEQGLLLPASFLHYIEGSNLEIDVGEWVIDSVLSQIGAWNAAGLDFNVSANISANHLLHPNFAERLHLSLERHPQVDPARLGLEIVETAALSDIEQAVRTLNQCREYGVRISLDDFGTGYSSLTYFRKLPIDILKIDQSFVRDMLDSPDDFDLIRNVVQLAEAFNRPVIAEGVETLEHGAKLAQIGCRLAQGYGIARPMPATNMAHWADEWQKKEIWLTLNAQTQVRQSIESTVPLQERA